MCLMPRIVPLTMRLLGGLLSSHPFLSVITVDASLRRRPMGRLIEPLRLMGADVWGRGRYSFAPLVIKGKNCGVQILPCLFPVLKLKRPFY